MKEDPLCRVSQADCPSRAGIGAQVFMAALEESERRFKAMVETSMQGKLVHRRYRPLFANRAMALLFGFDTSAEIVARPDILSLMDDQTRADPEGHWRGAILGSTHGRRWFTRRDGVQFRAEVFTRPVQWDGEPAIVMAVLDVTNQERAEREMRDALVQAEAAARGKRRFLAAASHQLRTPLNIVLGRLQLLENRPLDVESRAMADEALAASRRLLHAIEDVMDAAALESGSLIYESVPFDVAAMAEQAIGLAAKEAGDVPVVMSTSAPNVRLLGDERRIVRLIMALVLEALRRKPEESINLEVSCEKDGLALAVSAPGVGAAPSIPELTQTNPIDPMTLARALASGMGGVLVEHVGPTGVWSASTFLPLPRASAPPRAVSKALDILVVDDNAGNRKLLSVVIGALGHVSHMAQDGFEAVAAVTTRAFDLVLMDIAMPGMDGLEATRRIRALDAPWRDLPIAALTAQYGAAVQEAAEDAGMDAFLQKPIDLARLAEVIALLTGPSVETAEIDGVQDENHDEECGNHADRDHVARSQCSVEPGF
jgi:PAS domain S-box-containing protein